MYDCVEIKDYSPTHLMHMENDLVQVVLLSMCAVRQFV